MAEFSIIDNTLIESLIQQDDLGIGDDSAISPLHQATIGHLYRYLVAGRHFPLDTSAHAVGWKSVAVNLSDIAAMGAKPHSILLALSLPKLIMTGYKVLVRDF
jgi:thiamine-monophosphate kinase